jgi:hypothetical protein
MGTSNPYGGPKRKIPLLPPWADNGSRSPAPDGDADTDDAQADHAPGDTATATVSPPAPGFLGAGRRFSRFIGARTTQSLRSAARAYVRARGGSRPSSTAAASGRAATVRLGSFLADVANRGPAEALREIGLAAVIGKDAEVVFAAIANALAPAGATLEDAAARRAVDDALCLLFERLAVSDDGIAQLEKMDAQIVRDALEASLVSYVFHRWLEELGARLETKAISAHEAVQLEREVKQYVVEAVKIDFGTVDVLKTRWNGPQGSALVERIFREAYSLLEA